MHRSALSRVSHALFAGVLLGVAFMGPPTDSSAAEPIVLSTLPPTAISIVGTSGRRSIGEFGPSYPKLLLPSRYVDGKPSKILLLANSDRSRGFHWWQGAPSSDRAMQGAAKSCEKANNAKCTVFADGDMPIVSLDEYSVTRSDFIDLGEDRGRVVLGNENAPVVILAFLSHTCSFTGDFMKGVFPRLKSEYIDKGLVRFVARDYLRGNYDFLPARMMQCVPPSRHFDALQALYEKRGDWITDREKNESDEGKLRAVLAPFAKSPADLDACSKSASLDARLAASRAEAERLFTVFGTPSFSVNGILHHEVVSWDAWQAILKAHLERKGG